MMHACRWEGCDRPVPDSLYCCSYHWFRLPATMRTALWNGWRKGITSREYIDAHHQIQHWIEANK